MHGQRKLKHSPSAFFFFSDDVSVAGQGDVGGLKSLCGRLNMRKKSKKAYREGDGEEGLGCVTLGGRKRGGRLGSLAYREGDGEEGLGCVMLGGRKRGERLRRLAYGEEKEEGMGERLTESGVNGRAWGDIGMNEGRGRECVT